LEGVVETVGRFGIAAKERSLSVLLFSRRPWNALDRHCRLRLTGHSASSVRLLYLLLGYRLGFDDLPQVADPDEIADGELIIGDAALQRAARPQAGDNHIIDLATKWHRSQKLPFVFARWVVRRDAPPKAKKALADWLCRFQEEEDELVARCAPKAAAKLEAPLEAVQAYFRVIRRCLTEEDLAGQARFIEEFERHGREVLFG
jgi:chorismate dehydratase